MREVTCRVGFHNATGKKALACVAISILILNLDVHSFNKSYLHTENIWAAVFLGQHDQIGLKEFVEVNSKTRSHSEWLFLADNRHASSDRVGPNNGVTIRLATSVSGGGGCAPEIAGGNRAQFQALV